jgi:hypothetical protein
MFYCGLYLDLRNESVGDDYWGHPGLQSFKGQQRAQQSENVNEKKFDSPL